MESVITAAIILFLILFAALSLGETALGGQQAVYDAWQEVAAPVATELDILTADIIDDGETLTLTLQNTGAQALADFPTWDALVQYTDTNGDYVITWLPFAASSPVSNEWTVRGIYTDAAFNITETFDPDILNPGEEMIIELYLSPAVGIGEALRLVMFGEGAQASIVVPRNIPPTLATNQPLTVNQGEEGSITAGYLQVIDPDNTPEQLIYTVITAPNDGGIDDDFTQAMIDAGQVRYDHHSGTADDQFTFTVTDGVDTIGTYTFMVEINEPPYLTTNNGASITSGSTIAIDGTRLIATDNDNPANEIIYTVTRPPVQGSLSLGSSFTQEQINQGNLTYTHNGYGSDEFDFVISDGEALIGTYTFVITVL